MRPLIAISATIILMIAGTTQAEEREATTAAETRTQQMDAKVELIERLRELNVLLKRPDVQAMLQQKATPSNSCPLPQREVTAVQRRGELVACGTNLEGFRTRPTNVVTNRQHPKRIQLSGGISSWLRPYVTRELTPGYAQVVASANRGWHVDAIGYADYRHGTLHLVHPRMRILRRVVRMQAISDCPINTPYDIQEYEQEPESYEAAGLVRRLTNPRSTYALNKLLRGWTRVRHGVGGNDNVPGTVTGTSRGIEVVLNRPALTLAQQRHRSSARRVSSR